MPIIEVNGEPVSFPDNMSDAEIEAVLQKQFPPQKQIDQTQGNAGGSSRAFAYGVTGGQIPFGNVITSGIGAGIAKAASPFTGDERSYRELYDQAQADTKATQEANPNATLAGNVLGVVSTLPAAFSKPIQGSSLLQLPAKGLQSFGNFTTKMASATPFKGGGLSAWAGNTLARSAGGAAVAAPIGGLYAAGDANAGQRGEAFRQGALTAGGIGAALPLAGGVLSSGLNAIGKVTTPAINEAGAKIIDLAKKYNIPMGMDDLTDSSFYKTMISEGRTLPFSGAGKKVDNQLSSWMTGVAKSIGANTNKLTPDVISERFDTLGKEFDDFFAGKKISVGKNFFNKSVTEFVDDAQDTFGKTTDGYKHVQSYIKKIKEAVDENGVIDGEMLGKLRNKASKGARTAGNQEIASANRSIENFIVDLVGDADGSFKKTKYRYKNLIALEPLVQKQQISGVISPAQLLGRVRQVYGRQFTKGKAGELGDLANIGQYIKETIPNSGTSQRTGARNLLTGNVVGAIPTFAFGGPVAAAAQVGLSGLSLLANRGLQSRNFNPAVIEKSLLRLQGNKTPSIIGTGLNNFSTRSPLFLEENKK